MIEEAHRARSLSLAWHIPEVRHPDIPALDVLATLLGTGHSSRLYQKSGKKGSFIPSVPLRTTPAIPDYSG